MGIIKAESGKEKHTVYAICDMKSSFRKNLIPVLRIFAFLGVFAVLLHIFSLTYFSKANASAFEGARKESMEFYNEPENTIQIIAIGDSDLYSGFCPAVVWKECGYTSTAIGAPRQTPKQSLALLKDALKNQNPDIVIIECDMLYDDNAKTNCIKSKKNSIDPLFDYLAPSIFEDYVNDKFSVFSFHDKWKSKKLSGPLNKTHGYKYSNTIIPVVLDAGYMAKTDASEEIPPINIKDTLKMIECCRENGAEVILTTFASPSSWSYERYNAVNDFAKENGLAYIDFNLLFDEIKLDVSKDFRDKGNHLNYDGASKTTAYLAQYICKNYQIKDLRDDENYSYWHESCKRFDDMTLV